MPQQEGVDFAQRARESAVDYVISQVKDMLISGVLRSGSRLPPERELAERLGVSRGPLREAMKVLGALGVVTISQGDGTYISDGPRDEVYNPLVFDLILCIPSKEELLDLRESIEIGLERLVMKNATVGDIDRLEAANKEMRRLVETDAPAEEIAAADLAFHGALGSSARNRPIERIYSLVMEFIRPMIRETHRTSDNGRSAVALHTDIIAALRDRDSAAAREAIQRSIDHWANRFGQR